jgi:hypothetical protein
VAAPNVPILLAGQIVIPVPSANCPGVGGSGPDLNPIDHIPVIGDVAHLVSALGGIVSTVLGWIAVPGQAAHDILGWITWNTVGWNPDSPNCYDPTSAYGFARSVIGGDVQLDASSLYHDAYSSLALVSMVIVCAAAIARIVRSSHDQRTHWGSGVAETVLRAVAGIAAIQVGLAVLSWLIPLFSALAADVFLTFVGLAVPDPSGFDPLGALLFTGLLRLPQLGLVAIVLIPVLLFQLIRFVLLMVIRFIVISFGIAAAPLFFALAVFDHRAQVVQWWWRLMLGALVAPVVALGMLGLTIGLALRTAVEGQSLSSSFFGPLVSVILVIGGLWLTGKAMRALLFGLGGQHGSIVASVRHAAEALLFVPAAVASVAAGGALLAAGAGGGGALLRGLSSGRFGSGVVGSAMATDNALSRAAGLRFFSTPTQAFSAFKASPGGDRFIGEVTAGLMPPAAPAAARWAAVEQLPGMDSAMRRLRLSVHGQSTSAGRLEVAPAAWAAFDHAVTSAWPQRSSPPTERGPEPQPPANPGRSHQPAPEVRE